MSAAVLFVRVSSELDLEEAHRRVVQRKSEFLEVPGLLQKVYGRDPQTGDWCGIYFFESHKALADFRESALAKSIASAYDATSVRPEFYELVFSLRPDVGPFSD